MDKRLSFDPQTSYKCRKCRNVLFEESQISDFHSASHTTIPGNVCGKIVDVYFLREENASSWVRDQLEVGNWMKGKLFCTHCHCRIGSYDFVSGNKCPCGLEVLPAMHVVANKLDREVKIKPTPKSDLTVPLEVQPHHIDGQKLDLVIL